MAKAKRSPKLVIVADGAQARAVAEEQVSEVIGGATVHDAVDAMSADSLPPDGDVLANDEFGIVELAATDKEARDLAAQPGVLAVEDDVPVYALDSIEPGANDAAAGHLIDHWFDDWDSDLQAVQEATAHEEALLAAQVDPPPIDDLDATDPGHVGPASPGTGVSGVADEDLAELVRHVLDFAARRSGGSMDEVSDETIAGLLAARGVRGAGDTAAQTRDTITCGLRLIRAPMAWREATGRGVKVAILDTGIAPEHPDLRVYGGASFVPGVNSWHDDHYHGTHVAGTVAAASNRRGVVGVAPDARLYAVKVLDESGRAHTSWVLNGLAWCRREGMDIANLSLGSRVDTHDPDTYSQAYERAAKSLRDDGILAVAAAGNDASFVGNPARCPSFMAVSSIDCRRRRSSFSNYGPQVEICAPGSGVRSTYPPTRYRTLSGTSMAAPHVAGVAALVKERHPAMGGDAIRVHLWRTALDLGSPGRDWRFGFGQVNARRAVR